MRFSVIFSMISTGPYGFGDVVARGFLYILDDFHWTLWIWCCCALIFLLLFSTISTGSYGFGGVVARGFLYFSQGFPLDPMALVMQQHEVFNIFSRISTGPTLWIWWCSGTRSSVFFSRISTVPYGFGGVVARGLQYFSRGYPLYPMDLVM